MNRYVVNVLPGGRITLPAAVRKSLDLHPGDSLIWWWEDRELHFRKAEPDELVSSDDHPTTGEAPSSDADRTRKR